MPNPSGCLESVDVLVLAGGLGTRIQPVLGDVPKLLAPISGQPYLYYLLNWLRRYGANRVVLGLGHHAQAIVDYLQHHPPDGLKVDVVIEPRPLGTGGAIRFAADQLRSDPVIVMNGDSFAEADLCALLTRHAACDSPGTILCAEVEDGGRYGRVMVNGKGRIEGFVEKDANYKGRACVNAGIYVFSQSMLKSIAARDVASLEHEIFARLPAGSLGAFVGDFKFIDIGTPESLVRANSDLEAMFKCGQRETLK